MSRVKSYLPLTIRIIISGLFILSAVAKLFPIWAFEKQLVDLGIVDWCLAPYLSRLIIALETAIAIAILQRHYLKSIVIPLTLLLITAFCIHLGIQMYQSGAMNGNCGCFGQLIPMTPLEAFIKNIITIALLVYLYKNTADKEKGQNKFIYLLFIYFLSAFIIFFFFPFCPCDKKIDKNNNAIPVVIPDSLFKQQDSSFLNNTDTVIAQLIKDTSGKNKSNNKDSIKTAIAKVEEPKPVQSKFSSYTDFNGKKVSLDEGKKIVCLFVPGCDHCRDAAKEIVALSKTKKLPPVYILFMDEETFKIPEFFKEVKGVFPYYIINDIPAFFKLLGNNATTPGITYLWNGNIIKSYEGIGDHKFNAAEMIKAIESNLK
jgi:hypothetical protein